jgi:hypothetical protein
MCTIEASDGSVAFEPKRAGTVVQNNGIYAQHEAKLTRQPLPVFLMAAQ